MGLKVRGTRTLPTKFFSVFSSFVDKGDIMGGIELGRLPAKVNNTGRYSLSPYEQRPFANYIKKTIPNTIRRLSGQVLTILHTSASCIWPTDLLATGGIGQSGRTSRHWRHLSRKSTQTSFEHVNSLCQQNNKHSDIFSRSVTSCGNTECASKKANRDAHTNMLYWTYQYTWSKFEVWKI